MTTALTRKVIRADGSEIELPKAVGMQTLLHHIGADTADTVNLRRGGMVMVLDDCGHAKGRPINVKATALYHSVCKPGTTHQIVGDVAVVPDEDFA